MKPNKPIRLFWGENYSEKPLIVQKAIKKALINTTKKINLYPGSIYQDTVKLISKNLKVHEDQVMLGHGIEGLIHTTAMTFLGPNKVGGMFEPSFFVYDNNLNRCKPVRYPCTYNKKIDVKDFINKIKNTDVFYLASPNTATGNYLLTKSDIEFVLKNYKGLFVVDECYFGIGYQTVIDLIPKYDNLLIYRGVTKVMGLASLRLGIAIGDKKIIDKLKYNFTDIELDPLSTWSINIFNETFPYFTTLANNTNEFFDDFYGFMQSKFPKDKFIKTVTTFYFMDIRRYKVSRFKILNYMNDHNYLFSGKNLTKDEKGEFTEFIQLTPPPKKYWNNFTETLKKALNQ